ncbi:hypothetical protein IC582_026140 [Cucumis melo]
MWMFLNYERDLIKMPTKKKVVCESTSTLPLALKSILRYVEMEKDSSITFPLPADIFGISRKSSVLRDDIINLCNMNKVKTFTLVAYMMYLYSSVLGSKENVQYVFCPLQVGSTKCGYYVMKFMREIVNRGSIVISNFIDTQKPYSHAELDEGGCHYDVGREVEAAVDAELRQGAKVILWKVFVNE